MPKGDKLLGTIEAVHAAGLDETLWPSALSKITQLIGGIGTTMEAVDKSSMKLTDFWAHGIPPGSEFEYIDDFISISPRTVLGFDARTGDIGYDFMLLDDAAIDRDPYYSDFLRRADMRYFISGTLTRTSQEFACFAVQRSPRHGHVGKREIALMKALTPHLQQAFDVTRRLRGAGRVSRSLGHALDWLADGAAMVRADGKLLYANRSLQAISRRSDGIRISRNRRLEFATADVAARFNRALAAICGWQGGEPRTAAPADMIVPRAEGVPPYVISVRPLTRASDRAAGAIHANADADAIVFVHDPLQQDASTIEMLREIFGLTEAEASLARALQAGVSLADYARAHRLSLNTVYTHLRRVKEKTGCTRQAELVRKLGDMRLMVRSE